MRWRAASLLGVFLLTALVAIRPAGAHDETVSTSEVTITGAVLDWKVDVGVAGLEKVVKLPKPEAELTEADLVTARPEVGRYLAGGLTVELDGKVVAPELGGIEPRYEPSVTTGQPIISRLALTLRYRAESPISRVRCRVAFFSDLTKQHRAVITARFGPDVRQHVRLGVAELELSAAQPPPGAFALVREFLVWGAEHIFVGYDHIAFLLALLLVATRATELLKIVTAFTLAHSVTLLLAALEVVRLPSRVTEILIAASIVYVALENIFQRGARHRVLLTFAFGLVHGLGFATDLRDRLAELPGSKVLPVLSFNLGVELGQIVIVAIAFPLLVFLRRAGRAGEGARRTAQIARFASVPILLLGLAWLVERIAS